MLYIFDMGNVVVKGIDVLTPTIKLLGVEAQEFLFDYKSYDHPLMDGTFTCDSYYRHLENKFNVKVPGAPFADFFKPYLNEPIVEIIQKLKAQGHRVVAGSNTFKPHWDIIERLGYDRFFDRCYLSHIMGISKPAKAFFEYIMKQENVCAKDVFFTDDYQENIETAKGLGIKTFWYYKGYDDSKLSSIFS